MRHGRLLGFAALLCLPLAGHCADMYRWVDERGRTHIADTVPEKYRDAAKKLDSRSFEPTPQQRSEAAARAAKDRSKLSQPAPGREQAPASAVSPAKPAPTGSATPTGGTECDRLWSEFRESEQCMAAFMMGGRGIKAEAFEKCKEVRSPAQKCGPMK